MIGSTFTLKGKTYRNLEAQVLENQKKSIKNEQEITEIKQGGVGNWESGEGLYGIQQVGTTSKGPSSLSTNISTFAGCPTWQVSVDEIELEWNLIDDVYWLKLSSPQFETFPIDYIPPFRIPCIGYGDNNWILLSGEYTENGVQVPGVTATDIENVIFEDAVEQFIYIYKEDRDSQIQGAFASGVGSVASGDYSTATGRGTLASGSQSFAAGSYSRATGFGAFASGVHTQATNFFTHAEGGLTRATGERAHSEGSNTEAAGFASHAEGSFTFANFDAAHAEGYNTTVTARYGHAEGANTTVSGQGGHAEGNGTIASGTNSHAEGNNTQATNNHTHAEGNGTKATGPVSHAEGTNSTASGNSSHSEGVSTTASGWGSHAEGHGNTASAKGQHVEGLYSKPESTALHITGCGTNDSNRANCFTAGLSGTNKYIKVGDTQLTEKALANLLDLVTPIVIDVEVIQEGLEVPLPYTGNELADHLNLTIHWKTQQGDFIQILKIFNYYNDGDEVTVSFDASSYSDDGGASLVLTGSSHSNTYTVLRVNEV